MAISLGSIVVDLIANFSGFIQDCGKAAYAGKKATKEIHQSFDEMGSKIGSSLQGAFASLGQFGSVVGEFSRSIGEAFDGIGKGSNGIAVAVTALGALGAASIAAAAGFIELGKGGAELVEHLNLISQKTGISVRDLQIFEAAGKTVGVSLDDMVIGLRRFDQAITGFGKGAAAQGILRELGVTAKDNKEALLQTADAFSKMQDPVRRANDAVALFGRSGLNMIPVLMKGRDGILEWEKAVDTLGPKIGKEAVDANEKYRKSVEEMSLSWDKFKVQVEESTIPALSKLTSWFANNFQSMKAGLAGGFGAAAILKEQQAAQAALVNGAKEESATKDALLRKGEELQASLEKTFEIQKAGGSAGYALEKKRQELTDAIQNHQWEAASGIQSQLPGLEKAAALEAQRVARAKQLADSYASLQKFFENGAIVKPLLKTPKTDPTAGIEALFGPQPAKTIEAPDLGVPEFMKNIQAMPDLLKNTFGTGKAALDDFYNDWNKQQHGTEKSVNDDFDKQLAHWKDLLSQQAISLEQFKDVEDKINRERAEGLKRLRQDTGTSTFKDAWTDMFKQIENSGKDFARSITSDIGNAIESLNSQLVQFVATGKGLSIRKLGQDLQANLFGSLLKKGESSLFGSLGKVLGLGDLGGKPDGSSASKALFVQMAGLSAAGVGALPLGNLGGLGSLLGLGGSTTTGTTTPGSSSGGGGLLGGFGSFLGSIASFLPFLADGGDVQPGHAYVVGERRPELFVPRSAGTIVPSVPNSGTEKHLHVRNELHIHGVTDADSFKRSSSQILTNMTRAQQRAASR